MDINTNFSSPATPQTQIPKPKSRLALVLASILTLGLVAALFSGTLTNLFRGALIPFNGVTTQQVDVKYIPLGQTTGTNFSFTQATATRFTSLSTQKVYFGQKFNNFKDINLALFEQTIPTGATAVTPTELDPAIPHKFEVTAKNLTGAQNVEVLALMVDAGAYEKLFASTFVADANELCETQTDGGEDCQKYLEEMVKDADFVRFFNLTETKPTHELIVPRFLTQETPETPTTTEPEDSTLLGSYSKNTDFSKPRKLVLINSNNSLVSKYLAKRVEIDQENLTLNYCPLPPEPITNGLTIEGANGLRLSNFGKFDVKSEDVCTTATTDPTGCDPIAEFTVENELNIPNTNYKFNLSSTNLVAYHGDTLVSTITTLPEPTFAFSETPETVRIYATSTFSSMQKVTVEPAPIIARMIVRGGGALVDASNPVDLGTVPLNPVDPVSPPSNRVAVTYTQSEDELLYFSYPTFADYMTETFGSYQVRLKEKPTKDVFVNITPSVNSIELYSSLSINADTGKLEGTLLPQNSIKFTQENYDDPQTIFFKSGSVIATSITLNHTFEYGFEDPSDFNQFIGYLIDTLNNELETENGSITANVIDIKFSADSEALTPAAIIPEVGAAPEEPTDSWLDFNIDTFKPGAEAGSAVLTRTKLNFSNINQKFFLDGVNNVYEELVEDPRACAAFEDSNTPFALTTANRIKSELESKKRKFDTLSFLSGATNNLEFTTLFNEDGSLTEARKNFFKQIYLRNLYLEQYVFGKESFADIPNLITWLRLPAEEKTPEQIATVNRINAFALALQISDDEITLPEELEEITGATYPDELENLLAIEPSVVIKVKKIEDTVASQVNSAFREPTLEVVVPGTDNVNYKAITEYLVTDLAELVSYQTSTPETFMTGFTPAQRDYFNNQLSTITSRLNSASEIPLITGTTINYSILEQAKFDIDLMLESLDAQIDRLTTITTFCAGGPGPDKQAILAGILEELLLGDKKDNISINMPITSTNIPAVVELDRRALNEIRATYKDESEDKQIEFAALNNGVGYNNFNKLIFTYGAYSLGHLQLPSFEFNISRFFDPQPPTVFSNQELFDNALKFLQRTNLQAVDYINPTLNTSYVSLNSNYPKVKDFLSIGAAYFDANNYSFADFTTFNDNTSEEGVLVYAATKRNVQPAGTCSATTGSDTSVSEDTQFYIIPYKLVGTTTPVEPPVDPEEPPVTPIAGPACSVLIENTTTAINGEFDVKYSITSSDTRFNFDGKQIKLIGSQLPATSPAVTTNLTELSGTKTVRIPSGSTTGNYTFSILITEGASPTNLCNTSTSVTDTIAATAEVTGGSGGSGGGSGGSGGSGGGSTTPRTRGSASSQGYCRPGATLVDDYIIRENDLISEAITFNYNEGIFTGKPNPERRCPKNIIDLRSNLNRIEAAKVTTTLASKFDGSVSRLAQDPWVPADRSFGYRDLDLTAPENLWMRDIVKLAFRTKLFTGYGDSTFRAANTISYAEFMKVILLATNNASLDDYRIQQFSANGQPWYTGVMTIAKDKFKLSTLDPNRPLTRGDAIVIIYELETKGLYN